MVHNNRRGDVLIGVQRGCGMKKILLFLTLLVCLSSVVVAGSAMGISSDDILEMGGSPSAWCQTSAKLDTSPLPSMALLISLMVMPISTGNSPF